MSERIEAVQVEWDDYPDRVYLRGHWAPWHPRAEEALEVARAEFVEQAKLHGLLDELSEGEEWPCPPVGIRRLLWARWVPSQSGDWDLYFRTQTHPGRGAFAVTEVLDLAEQARQQAAREERESKKAEALAWYQRHAQGQAEVNCER